MIKERKNEKDQLLKHYIKETHVDFSDVVRHVPLENIPLCHHLGDRLLLGSQQLLQLFTVALQAHLLGLQLVALLFERGQLLALDRQLTLQVGLDDRRRHLFQDRLPVSGRRKGNDNLT